MSNGNCFWKTVKPLFSSKGDNVMNDVILMENNAIENDPDNVSNIMNEYYVNITRYIVMMTRYQSMINLRI